MNQRPKFSFHEEFFNGKKKNDDGLKRINFAFEDIKEAIKELKNNAPDTDSILINLLKNYPQELASLL